MHIACDPAEVGIVENRQRGHVTNLSIVVFVAYADGNEVVAGRVVAKGA